MNFIFDPSLVLYLPLYKLDSASFMSKDAYGHICTVTGALWRPQGRDFDGTDDKITVPDHTNWYFSVDFTIQYWINADSWAGNWWQWSVISQAESTGQDPKWFFTYDGTQTRFEFHTGTVLKTVLGDAWTANTGEWYCLGVTRIGDNYTFYKNGEINGTATEATAIPNVAADMLIGQGQGGTDAFDGLTGEVLIYNPRGLTPLEIQRNYLATKWRYR